MAIGVTSGLSLAAPRGWKTYQGMAFTVDAPSNWKATPKMQTSDSATFTSPDGRTRFSIFAPLWNGSLWNGSLWNGGPPQIQPAAGEKLVTRSTQMSKGLHNSAVRVTWLTFRSSDGRWTRSVVDREVVDREVVDREVVDREVVDRENVDRENVSLNTRSTFGFAYRDQKTYNRYKKNYESFKASWVHLGD